MTQKIKVAKSSLNVLQNTNPNNLTFSSDYNTLKYFIHGNRRITVGAGNYEQTVTIKHGLGYIPFFFALGRLSNDPAGRYEILPITNHFGETIEVYVDRQNLYLYAQGNNSTGGDLNLDFYYKIFKNNLNYI